LIIIVGATLLVGAVIYAGVPLNPHMIVNMVPIAIVLVALLIKGVSTIKWPAWLSLPIAFVIWGGTGGLVGGGNIGCAFCVAGFSLIGIGMGLMIDKRRWQIGLSPLQLTKQQEESEN